MLLPQLTDPFPIPPRGYRLTTVTTAGRSALQFWRNLTAFPIRGLVSPDGSASLDGGVARDRGLPKWVIQGGAEVSAFEQAGLTLQARRKIRLLRRIFQPDLVRSCWSKGTPPELPAGLGG